MSGNGNGNGKKMKAATVYDAWNIARRDAKAYQNRMAWLREQGLGKTDAYRMCQVARDACDRIALKIRYGSSAGHGRKKSK